jgi:hypothetical protein
MVKTYQVDIYDHSQVLHDGSSISWPLADGTGSLPALPYEAGDWILGNRGADTVYVSTDGTTLTFGASYDGSTFSGTGSDTTLSVMPYSGPYLSIAPGALNLEDEAFDNDIEILGVAGLVRDPNTSTVPISWTNGEAQIAGTNIVPGAVSYFQTTRNHHVRGHFVGGVFTLDHGATPAADHHAARQLRRHHAGLSPTMATGMASIWGRTGSSAPFLTSTPPAEDPCSRINCDRIERFPAARPRPSPPLPRMPLSRSPRSFRELRPTSQWPVRRRSQRRLLASATAGRRA